MIIATLAVALWLTPVGVLAGIPAARAHGRFAQRTDQERGIRGKCVCVCVCVCVVCVGHRCLRVAKWQEAILYRLAAFLPAWTMRPGATEPLTTGTDALLSQIARLCVRQFTSQHVLPPQLVPHTHTHAHTHTTARARAEKGVSTSRSASPNAWWR
jgi:hypothetical protein